MCRLLIFIYRDFASDVNLCLNIWITEDIINILTVLGSEEQTRSDMIILCVAFGSITFVIIPYIVNLLIAVRIKKYIKTNEAANAWFVYPHI